MKTNYSKLLTKLAATVGLASITLLIILQSGAKGVLNSQSVESGNAKSQQVAQQAGGWGTVNPGTVRNPRPEIFDQPPYNRGHTTPVTPAPSVAPAPSPTSPLTPRAKPATPLTLVALIASDGSFKTLTKALQAAGLTETLQGGGPFTIFAPTDAAFAKLPQDALQDLLKPENKEVLVKVLTYHMVPGKVLATDLKSGAVQSLQGGAITVKNDAKVIQVNDATVIRADITGSNGVIHAIDNLILPPDL